MYASRSEITLFLLEAGDAETVQEVLATARNYGRYGSARRAWNLIEKSTNPELLARIHEALLDSGPATPDVYANEHYDVPSSTRATLATLSIIVNSKAFTAEVTQWASQKQRLASHSSNFPALRESARAFSSHNLKALQEGRYSDAVVPPNPAQSSLPQGAPSSPEAVEGQPAAEVPAVDANALSGSPSNSPPSQGNLARSPWHWAVLIAVAVFASALGINRAIRARKGKAESNHRDR